MALASGSAGRAATPAPLPPSQVSPQAQNPWMALSMMTPAGATTLGAAGVAAQPPGDPPPQGGSGGIGGLPLPVLAIWLATIVTMVYIATHDDKDHLPTSSPD